MIHFYYLSIHFPWQNVAVLNCVDCVASFFFNQGNVNHDGWHQRADAPRLGHKIPALLLGCERFDTPCGGGRWFESFMEHLRGANTQEWDAVASAMERCVWYLWQALKYRWQGCVQPPLHNQGRNECLQDPRKMLGMPQNHLWREDCAWRGQGCREDLRRQG